VTAVAGRRLAVALVALLLAVTGAGAASAHAPDPMLAGGPMAQSLDLHFRWAAGGTPPAVVRTAILAAADDANTSRRAKAPTFTFDASGGNAVYYGTEVPCGINGLACFRRDADAGWFGVWLRENGHRYDWGTLRWCEAAGAPDGCYDIENIVLDELGHVAGLDHHENLPDGSDYLDAVVQTYAADKPVDGYNAHEFARCDVAALQQAYDVLAWTTPYSTCLDVPTKLAFSTTRTGVVAGSMVTFAASLTSNGTGRLVGNPVSGRSVVLQVKSGTGWVDVVTMPSGTSSGTYTGSVTVRASGEYRALFRKPLGEGVRTSASPSVVITVTAACVQLICPQAVHPATN
jgi:hypothetical protein